MQKSNPRIFGFACILIAVVFVTSLVAYSSYIGASSEKSPQATYHRLYGAPIVGGNYSFTPPIAKYQAINTALASDNWTQSDLQNMIVHVTLGRVILFKNVTAREELEFTHNHNITLNGYPNINLNLTYGGFEHLEETNASATNYHAIIEGGISLRYVWTISVQKTEGMTMHPWGYYMVDAATGELVPFQGYLF
jgi:hypothetical protein